MKVWCSKWLHKTTSAIRLQHSLQGRSRSNQGHAFSRIQLGESFIYYTYYYLYCIRIVLCHRFNLFSVVHHSAHIHNVIWN